MSMPRWWRKIGVALFVNLFLFAHPLSSQVRVVCFWQLFVRQMAVASYSVSPPSPPNGSILGEG